MLWHVSFRIRTGDLNTVFLFWASTQINRDIQATTSRHHVTRPILTHLQQISHLRLKHVLECEFHLGMRTIHIIRTYSSHCEQTWISLVMPTDSLNYIQKPSNTIWHLNILMWSIYCLFKRLHIKTSKRMYAVLRVETVGPIPNRKVAPLLQNLSVNYFPNNTSRYWWTRNVNPRNERTWWCSVSILVSFSSFSTPISDSSWLLV